MADWEDLLHEQENPEEKLEQAQGTKPGLGAQHLHLLKLRRDAELEIDNSRGSKEAAQFMWQHGRGGLRQLPPPRHAMQIISFMPQLQVHANAATVCATSTSSEAPVFQVPGNPKSPPLVSRQMNATGKPVLRGQ